MSSLEGRTALVTGGGRGIGRAISLALAEEGATVAVNYRSDTSAAQDTVERIENQNGVASAHQADVSDYEDCVKLVEGVTKKYGSIGILVHNAGIASRGLSVAETEPSELRSVISVHALAAHYLCHLLLPSMRECARGDVVVISSATTLGPIVNGAPYNMGKAALEVLATTIAREERSYGIRANIVAPGLVDTEMGRRMMKANSGVADLREFDDDSPFAHVLQPEEVARVVRFLVSAENTYITGECVTVDGGGTVDRRFH